jgi:hypothetical protein
MRIVSHHNNSYIHSSCLMCSNQFELGVVAHDAYSNGEHLGSICEACMALTVEEQRATMHAYASSLRGQAKALDDLAEEPWQMTRTERIDVTTGEPYGDQTPCDCCSRNPSPSAVVIFWPRPHAVKGEP